MDKDAETKQAAADSNTTARRADNQPQSIENTETLTHLSVHLNYVTGTVHTENAKRNSVFY